MPRDPSSESFVVSRQTHSEFKIVHRAGVIVGFEPQTGVPYRGTDGVKNELFRRGRNLRDRRNPAPRARSRNVCRCIEKDVL